MATRPSTKVTNGAWRRTRVGYSSMHELLPLWTTRRNQDRPRVDVDNAPQTVLHRSDRHLALTPRLANSQVNIEIFMLKHNAAISLAPPQTATGVRTNSVLICAFMAKTAGIQTAQLTA